jgi:hypothetical protein
MSKYRKILIAVIIVFLLAVAGMFEHIRSREALPPVATADATPAATPTDDTTSPAAVDEPPAAAAEAAPVETESLPVETTDDVLPLEDNSASTAAQSAVLSPSTENVVTEPVTVTDKYLTDPVPEGNPMPVEPQNITAGSGEYSCTLSVRCDTILDNMNLLNKEKWELVPQDGIIFPATTVTFYENESVFNVLQREMRRAKINLEFVNTPIYNSAYIEGINNLYEFDVGELSGWMYKVNDWYPNYGSSRYQLKDGDVVEWRYTCDLGRDLGEYWIKCRQKVE